MTADTWQLGWPEQGGEGVISHDLRLFEAVSLETVSSQRELTFEVILLSHAQAFDFEFQRFLQVHCVVIGSV